MVTMVATYLYTGYIPYATCMVATLQGIVPTQPVGWLPTCIQGTVPTQPVWWPPTFIQGIVPTQPV